MKLNRLEIQQLPGIEPGFTLDGISPAVNLVVGPNAVGKSSLIRALRLLIEEPRSADPPAVSLSAVFSASDGRNWSVHRAGRQVVWRCGGQAVEPPPLPDSGMLRCYWLTMEDLAVTDGREEVLVEQLQHALTGGHDLQGLRDSLFPRPVQAGRHERIKLEQARSGLREVESGYLQLQREEQDLPDLFARVEAARDARQRAQRLDAAIQLHDVLAEQRRVQSRLDEFPGIMERLRGNEAEQLDSLEQRCRELEEKRKRVRQALESARQELRQLGLGDDLPDAGELDEMRGVLEEAQRHHEQYRELHDQWEQARTDEELARQALGAAEGERLVPPDRVDAIADFLSRLERNRQAMESIRGRFDAARDGPDDARVRRHWQAVDALTAWLAATATRSVRQWSRFGLLVGGAGGLTTMGIALSLPSSLWLVAANAVGLSGVIGALIMQFRDPVAAARRAFPEPGPEGPGNWQPGPVRERLEQLRSEAIDLQSRRDAAVAARTDHERWMELEQEAAVLEKEKQQWAAGAGFDPDRAGPGIQRFLQLVERHDQALAVRRALEAKKSGREQSVAAGCQQVSQFLERLGQPAPDDLPRLRVALQTLTERVRRAQAAARSRDDASREMERIEQEWSARQHDIETLYQAAGLPPGDRVALEGNLAQLEEWQGLRSEWQTLKGREGGPRQALAGDPELLRAAESGDRDTLLSARDDSGSQGEEYEPLLQQHSELKFRLDSAGTDRRLEDAVHRVDQAQAAFMDRREEQLFAEAGRFLLDDIEEEHHNEHEPEVLREARELFSHFTHQAWDVQIDEQGLQALDRKAGEVRPLSALSSGTRMQLLLAVRLAWTRRLERGRESLPLFLDEALTTSDEARFAAVVGSLAALSRTEGRQVFYLSARQHEHQLWEQVTGETPHRIDMAELRFGRPDVVPENYSLAAEEEVPAPGSDTPEAYAARLSVPTVNPWLPPGDIHLFHLLRDDLPLLHRLVQDWRVTSLAQLEGLLKSSGAAAAVQDNAQRDVLACRCSVARRWHALWHLGRNRPVDSVVLQQSEPVTETFLEAVSQLADDVGGDPEELVAALRDKKRKVPRFLNRKVDALEEWLEQHGYITPGEPLEPEQRLRRMLEQYAHESDPAEIRRVVQWLEGSLVGHTISASRVL